MERGLLNISDPPRLLFADKTEIHFANQPLRRGVDSCRVYWLGRAIELRERAGWDGRRAFELAGGFQDCTSDKCQHVSDAGTSALPMHAREHERTGPNHGPSAGKSSGLCALLKAEKFERGLG